MGSGIPVGSMLLIEEDVFNSFSQLVLKYFFSEGIAYKHQIYFASVGLGELNPNQWLKNLPLISSTSTEKLKTQKEEPSIEESNQGNIKIAWQYQKYLKNENETLNIDGPKKVPWCHSFNFLKKMDPIILKNSNIETFDCDMKVKNASSLLNYKSLYNKLIKIIQENNESLSKSGQSNIIRIGISSLGSPLWGSTGKESKIAILQFLRALRGLLRQSLAVCVLTFPAHLYKDDSIFLTQVRHFSDSVVQFSAFIGSYLF